MSRSVRSADLIVPGAARLRSRSRFADIENDLAGYAVKAREGKISMDDLRGGVFTDLQRRRLRLLLSTPILNSPQSGILGMHKIQERSNRGKRPGASSVR